MESRRQQPSTDHIPKYAAGDDMDRINRNAYALWSEKTFSFKELPIIFVGILVLIGVFMSELHQAKPVTPPTAPSAPTRPSPVQPTIPATVPAPTETEKLQAEINSADFSTDYSKVYVTYTYSNNTNSSFYSIVTTINLEDENGTVLQSKIADTIDVINAKDSKEITVSLTIEPENIGKVKRVKIYPTYQRR